MKLGQSFENNGMKLLCLAIQGEGEKNVGLFLRPGDGMYITARNVSQDDSGLYTWDWGHYFPNFHAAAEDYKARADCL